jgi:hypothetical protein
VTYISPYTPPRGLCFVLCLWKANIRPTHSKGQETEGGHQQNLAPHCRPLCNCLHTGLDLTFSDLVTTLANDRANSQQQNARALWRSTSFPPATRRFS